MKIYISDFFHYRQIGRKLKGRGFLEGLDYFGGFEYLAPAGDWKREEGKAFAWKDRDVLISAWRERVSQMASFLDEADARVLDVGCGEEYLKRLLRGQGKKYYSCDYKKRGPDTIVCDFDRRQFPDLAMDAAFVSGCIEYVKDAAWLAGQCASAANKVIVSYLPLEYMPNPSRRARMGYRNHYSIRQFVELFEKNGLLLAKTAGSYAGDLIFVFRPSGRKERLWIG